MEERKLNSITIHEAKTEDGIRRIRVERLTEPDGRLFRLEDRFRRAVGEEPMTEEERERLSAAVRAGQIVFFLAMWETQAVGLCSVSPCFSTFACGEVGSFEDFYLEPDFLGKGAARLLAQAARDWCREASRASPSPAPPAMRGCTGPWASTRPWGGPLPT